MLVAEGLSCLGRSPAEYRPASFCAGAPAGSAARAGRLESVAATLASYAPGLCGAAHAVFRRSRLLTGRAAACRLCPASGLCGIGGFDRGPSNGSCFPEVGFHQWRRRLWPERRGTP